MHCNDLRGKKKRERKKKKQVIGKEEGSIGENILEEYDEEMLLLS